MKIYTRKEGNIFPPLMKINKYLVYALLYVTFILANIFVTRSAFMMYGDSVTTLLPNVDTSALNFGLGFFIAFLCIEGLFEILIMELFLSASYFFGYQSMRGQVPFTVSEFKANMRPYVVLRNVILACLNALMFIPSGYFIGVGSVAFKLLSTAIIFFPAFFYFKKHYVAVGYSQKTLLAFAVPFATYNGLVLLFSII